MAATTQKLSELGIAHTPKFLPDNIHYETIMGSFSYGVSSDTSDMDIYGFCIPPLDDIFPHLRGEILGFGTQHNRFEQYQEHHLVSDNKSYDLSIYSIVKYLDLVMDNNPNMVDSLFTPINCVLHMTRIGQMVRDQRKMFLHKGSYHKFRGYAYAQLSKIKNKERTTGKRAELIQKYGYDTKFAYHIIRLLDECEQILLTGDLDLQRSKEVMKSVRNGEWTLDQVMDYFDRNERKLEEYYHSSTLQYSPDKEKIKQLLIDCLEAHYGSIRNSVILGVQSKEAEALQQIASIVQETLVKKS